MDYEKSPEKFYKIDMTCCCTRVFNCKFKIILFKYETKVSK